MDEQTSVLVVGGSLVGLTASVLLAHHGVPHVLIERHRGTAIHPRAAAFHQRTIEIFRSVGLQEQIEQAAAGEFLQDGAILSVESLGGPELAWFYRSVNEGVEDLSPARRLFITQIGLEPILRKRAQELGAVHCYGTEMTSFVQHEDGITATTRSRDSGAERRIVARYMIGADGAHSPVRQALDIAMEGRGAFARCATIYFKADVRALLRGRNLSVVYVNQPGMLAFFRFSINADSGFLAVFSTFDAQGRRDSRLEQELSAQDCTELVRAALGMADDFPVAIENVQPWIASAATAARFRQGNVFLAGDAAHVMPPTGGFGGNTGVADVHNLVWKLAMVLDAHAGPALLDSYDAERRPMAALTVEQAYRRYVERVDPSIPADGLAASLADTAIELGSVYRSGAVIADGEATALVEAPETATSRPGTRFPHCWIGDGPDRISTIDLASRSLMLIAGDAGDGWITAVDRLGLSARQIREPAVAAALGLKPTSAVLLRPDGVVGWRCDNIPRNAATIVADAIRQLTARTP